ncbi:MAG: RIP metalloprotease [Chloroflexi bacterium]|nr:MAG: RIP metalloprotease [Chloroflexota bacterium]
MTVLWSIIGFFIVLTPIIIIHELGHFWAARLSGVQIEEFGLGIPPRALTLGKRNGTLYTLNWIPIGGFVRPAGEDDPSIPGGLAAASKRVRFFVLSAGSLANLITALFIFWVAYLVGPPAIAIAEVRPNTPAMAAGLQPGDIILEVAGRKADTSNVVAQPMYLYGGQPVEMVIERDGQQMTITVVPRKQGEYDPEIEGPLGVSLQWASGGKRLSRGPGEAFQDAAGSISSYARLFVQLPAMLISGQISPSEARPVSFVGISQIAGDALEVSVNNDNLFPVLNMMAFISVALGLTNLLPIPALDGGRILFVIIEALRGERIEPENESKVHIVGMILLLALMFLMVIQDIVNPIIQ